MEENRLIRDELSGSTLEAFKAAYKIIDSPFKDFKGKIIIFGTAGEIPPSSLDDIFYKPTNYDYK